MTVETAAVKHEIPDKLESQLNSAEAKLNTLKARAEVTKGNLEIKAIANLATQKLELQQKLQELKKAGDGKSEQAKRDLESRIAAFEKSIREIEAKVKAR